jgi:hypothetical protein
VVFAPTAVSLLSKVSTVAFNTLGCWSAKYTLALDTWKEYRGSNSFEMVRKYCDEMFRQWLDMGIENVAGAAINVGGVSAFLLVSRTFSYQSEILNW